MRIIHSEGFNAEEKSEIKNDIASNIANALVMLIENSTIPDEPKGEEEVKLKSTITRILSIFEGTFNNNSLLYEPKPSTMFELADEVTFIWESAPIQAAYANRNTFQLIDCAKYFLSQVHRVMNPDFVPDNQDITQTRVKTEGIIEHEFQITGSGPARGKIIMVSHFY